MFLLPNAVTILLSLGLFPKLGHVPESDRVSVHVCVFVLMHICGWVM